MGSTVMVISVVGMRVGTVVAMEVGAVVISVIVTVIGAVVSIVVGTVVVMVVGIVVGIVVGTVVGTVVGGDVGIVVASVTGEVTFPPIFSADTGMVQTAHSIRNISMIKNRRFTVSLPVLLLQESALFIAYAFFWKWKVEKAFLNPKINY